jgi:hypothetical protein
MNICGTLLWQIANGFEESARDPRTINIEKSRAFGSGRSQPNETQAASA